MPVPHHSVLLLSRMWPRCSSVPTSWTRKISLGNLTPSWCSTGATRMEREFPWPCPRHLCTRQGWEGVGPLLCGADALTLGDAQQWWVLCVPWAMCKNRVRAEMPHSAQAPPLTHLRTPSEIRQLYYQTGQCCDFSPLASYSSKHMFRTTELKGPTPSSFSLS